MSNPLLELSDMSEDQLRQQLILLELEQRKVQLQIDTERIKEMLLSKSHRTAAPPRPAHMPAPMPGTNVFTVYSMPAPQQLQQQQQQQQQQTSAVSLTPAAKATTTTSANATPPATSASSVVDVIAAVRPGPPQLMNAWYISKPGGSGSSGSSSKTASASSNSNSKSEDEGSNPEWYGHGESKLRTKPCRWHHTTFGCKHADACRFSHDMDSAASGSSVEDGASSRSGSGDHFSSGVPYGVCRAFARAGACRYGDSCRFLHVLTDGGNSSVGLSSAAADAGSGFSSSSSKAARGNPGASAATAHVAAVPVQPEDCRLFVTTLHQLQQLSIEENPERWVYCSKHGIRFVAAQRKAGGADATTTESAAPYKNVRAAVIADGHAEMPSSEDTDARGALVIRLTQSAMASLSTLYTS